MAVGAAVAIILEIALWAALATLGFAILFNVPRGLLKYCVFAGASGYIVRTILLHIPDIHLEAATLVGAIVIGFEAQLFARAQKKPGLIFAVSAAIPMVPGKLAFETLIMALEMVSDPLAVDRLVGQMMAGTIETGLILSAIAVGISMPALLLRREQPVV